MKKTILVATDFSFAAFNAACYAADMAVEVKADILLVHIYRLPVAYNKVPAAVNEEEIRVAVKNINALKAEMTRRTSNKININTELRCGSFYEGLEAVCNNIHPYLVVLGNQGTLTAEQQSLGNHAIYAMKHLPWSLVTIPPKTEFSSFKKIGLACDLNKIVDTIPADEIKMLVHDFNARLHILYTTRTKELNAESIFESGLLQELIGTLNPEYHFIASTNSDEGIIEFAKTNHIDLLVVIPRHTGPVNKLHRRSHTKQLVLRSPIPVMAIHP